MAYNVLKGSVDGSVDQHGDQEINGVKIFKNTVSASVFWDTDAQSPCATLKDVPITKVEGGAHNSVLVWKGDNVARAEHALTFDGGALRTNVVEASHFMGSGAGLYNLPTNKFTDTIKASHMELGNGVRDVRGVLQVAAAPGISVDDSGVGLDLDPIGGLSLRSGKLGLDFEKATNVVENGQNLSDDDFIAVVDKSRRSIVKTTLSNFYQNYIHVKAPKAHGQPGALQIKSKNGFTSSPALSYDSTRDILNVHGTLEANKLQINGHINCAGAVIKNIATTSERLYVVKDGDYTIVCDTVSNPIDVKLPPACNHKGRILNFKKASSDKYNLRSHPVVLRVDEGTIDRHPEMTIKNNYSVRCLQSDGENWWVISTHSN